MRVSRDQNLINFSFKMSICANSLWNSCNSGINIEAHSLGSQQLADHFPMRLPIEADLDPIQNLGFGAPMSTICKTFAQIASSRAFGSTRVINLSHQSNRFAYLEIIHVSDQLRASQIIVIYHVSSLLYHSSSNFYHASLIIQQHDCHQSSVIHHLSSGFMLHDFD